MSALVRRRVAGHADLAELGTPAALLVDASTAVVLDLSTTSPDLDAGAWLDADAELRLAAAHDADFPILEADAREAFRLVVSVLNLLLVPYQP